MSRMTRARSSSLTRVRQAAARVFGYDSQGSIDDKFLFGSGKTESAAGIEMSHLSAPLAQKPRLPPSFDLVAGDKNAIIAAGGQPPLVGPISSGRKPRASSSGKICSGDSRKPQAGGNAAVRSSSPASLRRLWKPAPAAEVSKTADTRDGFEEFFGYGEGADAIADELPSLLRDRRVRSPPEKRSIRNQKADIVAISQAAEKVVHAQASFPQVMDATEASLSIIRNAIEERKALLKEKRGQEFDQLCAEIQQLKWQQTRLASALWQGQLQDADEDGCTEMQLKAWLGNA